PFASVASLEILSSRPMPTPPSCGRPEWAALACVDLRRTPASARHACVAEVQDAVLELRTAEGAPVVQIALAQPPRLALTLVGELVEGAQHVAGGEVHEREWRDRRVPDGHDAAIAVLGEVGQQPAGE